MSNYQLTQTLTRAEKVAYRALDILEKALAENGLEDIVLERIRPLDVHGAVEWANATNERTEHSLQLLVFFDIQSYRNVGRVAVQHRGKAYMAIAPLDSTDEDCSYFNEPISELVKGLMGSQTNSGRIDANIL